MVWKKANDAARDWAGGVSVKTLYAAVRDKRLRAAKTGSRNLLFCEQWVDEWLLTSADSSGASER